MDHSVFKDLLFMGGYVADPSILASPKTGSCDCGTTQPVANPARTTKKPKSRIDVSGLTHLVGGVA